MKSTCLIWLSQEEFENRQIDYDAPKIIVKSYQSIHALPSHLTEMGQQLSICRMGGNCDRSDRYLEMEVGGLSRFLLPCSSHSLKMLVLPAASTYQLAHEFLSKKVKIVILPRLGADSKTLQDYWEQFYTLFFLQGQTLYDAFWNVTESEPELLCVGEFERSKKLPKTWNLLVDAQTPHFLNASFNQILHLQDSNLSKYLTVSPPKPIRLFGCERLLQALEQPNEKIVYLYSPSPKSGKTVIAAQHWHSKSYAHSIWIHASDGILAGSADLMRKLLVSQHTSNLHKSYQSTLSWLPSETLIVFDNLLNINELYDLKLHLLTNVQIIITTTIQPPMAAQILEVSPMSETAASALFEHHYRAVSEAERPILHQILNKIHFNPCKIEQIALKLKKDNRFNPNQTSLQQVLDTALLLE